MCRIHVDQSKMRKFRATRRAGCFFHWVLLSCSFWLICLRIFGCSLPWHGAHVRFCGYVRCKCRCCPLYVIIGYYPVVHASMHRWRTFFSRRFCLGVSIHFLVGMRRNGNPSPSRPDKPQFSRPAPCYLSDGKGLHPDMPRSVFPRHAASFVPR